MLFRSLEIYRPRLKGKVVHPLYDSRLVGLVSHPEGVFSTAASALDYQFGFKVSDTWFYQFLKINFPWLALAQLALLLVSSGFVFINPGEQALLERLGRPVVGREVLGPGLHLKWPYPIDDIHRFRTEEVQSSTVGGQPANDGNTHARSGFLFKRKLHHKGQAKFCVTRVFTWKSTKKKNAPRIYGEAWKRFLFSFKNKKQSEGTGNRQGTRTKQRIPTSWINLNL